MRLEVELAHVPLTEDDLITFGLALEASADVLVGLPQKAVQRALGC